MRNGILAVPGIALLFVGVALAERIRFAGEGHQDFSVVHWELRQDDVIEHASTVGSLVSWTLEPASERVEVRYRRCNPAGAECGSWSTWGQFLWKRGADLDADGVVGLSDFGLLASQFGEPSPELYLCKVPSL